MERKMGRIEESVEKGGTQGKSRWPAAIVGLLAVVFLVNAFVLYLSLRTDDGLVNEDYYMKGLFYDEGLKGAEKLGWDIGFSFDSTPAASATGLNPVRVEIIKGGGEVLDAQVTLTLKRPATDIYDTEYSLVLSNGAYTGELVIPARGFWDIEVHAGKGGLEMAKTFRIRV